MTCAAIGNECAQQRSLLFCKGWRMALKQDTEKQVLQCAFQDTSMHVWNYRLWRIADTRVLRTPTPPSFANTDPLPSVMQTPAPATQNASKCPETGTGHDRLYSSNLPRPSVPTCLQFVGLFLFKSVSTQQTGYYQVKLRGKQHFRRN